MNNITEILNEWRKYVVKTESSLTEAPKLPGNIRRNARKMLKKKVDVDKTVSTTAPDIPAVPTAGDTQVVKPQTGNTLPIDSKNADSTQKLGSNQLGDPDKTMQTSRAVPDPDAPTAQTTSLDPGATQRLDTPKPGTRTFIDSQTPLDDLIPKDFRRDMSWVGDMRARIKAGKAARDETVIIDALDQLGDRISDPGISKKVAAFIEGSPKKVFSVAAAAMIGVVAMSSKDNFIQKALLSQDSDAAQGNIDRLEGFIKTIAPKDPEGPEMSFTADQANSDPDGDVSDKDKPFTPFGDEIDKKTKPGSEGDTAYSRARAIAKEQGLDAQAVEDDIAELRTNSLFQANIGSRYKLQNLPNRAVRLFMVSLIRELDKFYKEKAPNSNRKEIIRNMLDLDDQKIKDLQIRSSVISEAVGGQVGARKTPLGREPQKYEDRRQDMIQSIEYILEMMRDGAFNIDPRWERINKAIEGGMYGKSGPDKLRDNAVKQISNQLKKLIKKAYNDVMNYGPVKKQMKDLEDEGFDDPLGYLKKYDLTSKEK
jgi:hypothetical protein